MRLDLRKELLERFAKPQDVEEELKTSIINTEMYAVLVMCYDIYSMSPRSMRLNESFIKGILMASRGIGGKGSEQLLQLLAPTRIQQYLFPAHITPEKEESGEEEKKEEQKKKRFKLF